MFNNNCGICYENTNTIFNNNIYQCYCCKNIFHIKCIQNWFNYNYKCPYCCNDIIPVNIYIHNIYILILYEQLKYFIINFIIFLINSNIYFIGMNYLLPFNNLYSKYLIICQYKFIKQILIELIYISIYNKFNVNIYNYINSIYMYYLIEISLIIFFSTNYICI